MGLCVWMGVGRLYPNEIIGLFEEAWDQPVQFLKM